MDSVTSIVRKGIEHLRTHSRSTSKAEVSGVSTILGQLSLSASSTAVPELTSRDYMRVTVYRPPRRKPTLDDRIQERTLGSFSLLLSLPVEIQMHTIDIIEEDRKMANISPEKREGHHPLLALRG